MLQTYFRFFLRWMFLPLTPFFHLARGVRQRAFRHGEIEEELERSVSTWKRQRSVLCNFVFESFHLIKNSKKLFRSAQSEMKK